MSSKPLNKILRPEEVFGKGQCYLSFLAPPPLVQFKANERAHSVLEEASDPITRNLCLYSLF